MFGQTSVNNAPQSRTSGIREIIGDCMELGALQLQLLSVDGKQASQHAVKAIVLGVAALLFGIATLIAATLGCGWLIHELGGLSVGVSLLIVAGCMLLLTAGLGVGGALLLKRASGSMQESVSELQANAKWIKEVLLDPESPRNQIRSPTVGQERWDRPTAPR